MSGLPPLEITTKNRRRTGVTLAGSSSGKGDWRRSGDDPKAYRENFDKINWTHDASPLIDRGGGCCGDPSDCRCTEVPKALPEDPPA